MRLLLTVPLILALGGCGALGTLGAVGGALTGGGGPSVNANVQAGKTNSQTVGTTENTSQKIVRPQARDIRQSSDTNSVRSDAVENLTVNQIPTWLLVAMAATVVLFGVVGWLSPQPKWLKKKKADP